MRHLLPSSLFLAALGAGCTNSDGGKTLSSGGGDGGTASAAVAVAAAPVEVGDTNDDETQVVPPESVSGAFLACGGFEGLKDAAHPDAGFYGCSALRADKTRIPLAKAKKQPTLSDRDGQPIGAVLVKDANTDVDVLWRAPKAALDAGVRAELSLLDAQGKPAAQLEQNDDEPLDPFTLP